MLARDEKIAFLGPWGTYSHQATIELFGESAPLLPCGSIADVFASVKRRQASAGVVPIRNSKAGPVSETRDALNASELRVEPSEYALKIRHSLMGRQVKVGRQIKRIYSHEQALQQCAHYLDQHYSTAERVEVSSTAAAAAQAAADDEALAICSVGCAKLYDLTVLAYDIQDAAKENTTYFITLRP